MADPQPLDRRSPQESTDAQVDRWWRIEGVIDTPKAEPSKDINVMARVEDGLRRL